MLTWTPNPVPYDQAFDAIKAAIDAMPAGVKLFINSGAFAVYLPTFQVRHSPGFQASSMAKVSQQQTWTCSPRSTKSTLDMRKRPSCP